MKIYLLIPTLKHGGAERVISEYANAFSHKGYNVSVILWIGGEILYPIDQKVKIINFNSAHNTKIDKAFNLIKVIYKLRKIYKIEKPDVVISFLTKSNILALLAKSFMPTRVYISERNSPDRWNSHPKGILALRNMTYTKATGFIAQTNAAKTAAQERFNISKSTVIPNPIKEIVLSKIKKQENIILNVGRLTKQKGQKYLLEAFAKLDRNKWKLVILGEGELREELEKHAEFLGISDRVLMPGSVSNIDEWLAKASIFAFSSLYEGFPNALLEAMGAGLPCVSYDCDTGPSDLIVDGKNGFLVSAMDVELFTKRLQQLTDDEILRANFSIKAKKVNEIYSLETITNKLLNFLNNREDKYEK